jgi:dynein heavy chain
VRRLLKVVLCFSPVGSTLRVRGRKFPAIINCTNIDWFHEWPEQALKSVAKRFLGDVDLLPPAIQESVSDFMAFVHKSVNEMSVQYLQNDRRYNYTTPKSFLEQISLYKRLLQLKYKELQEKIVRLENGLVKLQSTSKQVDDLKDKLAAQEVEVKQKNEDADKLIKIVGAETEKVGKEKAIADEEQAKVTEISIEVGKKQADCERDLEKAMPALEAAQTALNTLDKTNLTEMKSFPNPPSAVLMVASAVLVLMAPGGKVPKDRSWKAAKAMMGNVDQFLNSLKTYDKDNIPEMCRKEVQVYVKDPTFEPDLVKSQSQAAAGLCSWVINILKYYEVYCDVAPKRMALNKANAELQAAKDKLAAVEKKVTDLQAQLKTLTDEFNVASEAKAKCERDAQQTAYTIQLANRLVGGLSSEKIRWTESVANFRVQEKSLPGNVLLITAFISYVGCFTKIYRVDLMEKYWMPFLGSLKVISAQFLFYLNF